MNGSNESIICYHHPIITDKYLTIHAHAAIAFFISYSANVQKKERSESPLFRFFDPSKKKKKNANFHARREATETFSPSKRFKSCSISRNAKSSEKSQWKSTTKIRARHGQKSSKEISRNKTNLLLLDSVITILHLFNTSINFEWS